MWIDTVLSGAIPEEGGAVRRDAEGRFELKTAGLDEEVEHVQFFEDHRGRLWIWAAEGLLKVFSEDRWQDGPTGVPDGELEDIFLFDRSGRIYRFGDGGLSPIHFLGQAAPRDESEHQRPLLWSRGDELWTSDDERLYRYRLDPKTHQAVKIFSTFTLGKALAMVETRDEELWLSIAGRGLFLVDDDRLLSTYATSAEIAVLIEDREGSLWGGTRGEGLVQVLPRPRVAAFSTDDGLAHNEVRTVVEQGDSLWIAGRRGLDRLTPEGITSFGPQSVGEGAQALALDASGALWSGNSRLSRFDGDSFQRMFPSLVPEVLGQILPTPDGGLWIASESLIYLPPREFEDPKDSKELEDPKPSEAIRSLPVREIRGLHLDRRGALWIASAQEGLWTFANDTLQRLDTGPEPITFASFFEEDDGTLWVASRGSGIFRAQDRKLLQISRSQGLFDDTIHHILDDRRGGYWLTSDRGISRVPKADLRAVAEGRRAVLRSEVFGVEDGMLNMECNSGFPGPARLQDGRLVFPTMKGLAIVDPTSQHPDPDPPQVEISRLMVEHSPLEPGPEISLLEHQRSLSIEYSAKTFVSPRSTPFRYRLEGFDRDWIDAGNRRAAFYTQLPPGRYTFRVQAGNGAGRWSREEARLDLHLPPRFYETRFFFIFPALAATALIWALARRRQARLHRRKLESMVAERTAQLQEEKAKTQEQAAKLAELARLKDRFLANISHDLRTPLTLLSAPLQDSGSAPPIEGETLQLMRRSAQKLEQRIDELLELSRLEAGEMPLRCEPLDLVAFCRERITCIEPLAKAKDLTVELVTDSEKVLLFFDSASFDKIFDNLLDNAVKYSDPGGTITVQIAGAAHSDRVEWTVADEGVGIEEDQLEKVFQRFHRARTDAKNPGTGIGLALTKEWIHRHGGRIHVQSRLGQGSRFIMMLPKGSRHLKGEDFARTAGTAPPPSKPASPSEAAERPMSPATSARPPAHAPEGATPTLLVAEDDRDMRAYLRSLLAVRFMVLEAADGSEALELATSMIPDLVLTDLAMPRVDGLGLAKELRRDPRTDHIPIVFLTARGSEDLRVEGFRTGIDAYLTKPFSPRELTACIDGLLALRERLRDRYRRRISLESRVLEAEPEADRFLRQLLETVENRMSDNRFGVFELAEEMALSRRQLNRKLTALTDESPSTLIRRLRLEKAHQLLRQQTGTVAEVAYAVGFAKPSHFSRVFRKTYGMSPSSLQPPPSVRRADLRALPPSEDVPMGPLEP